MLNERGSVLIRFLVLIGALSVCVGVSLIGCQWDGDKSEETASEVAASPEPLVDTTPSTEPATTAAPSSDSLQTPGMPDAPEGAADGVSELTTEFPARLEDGEALYRERDYAEAADVFERYCAANPEDSHGRYMLGMSAWKAGDLDRATQGLEQTLELDPDHARGLVNLARVRLDAGQPRQALPHVDHAVDLDSGDVAARRVLGRVYAELGMTEDAEETYRGAVILDDSDVWSLNNLGFLLIEQERFEEALGPLARAVELNEHSPVFRNNLGTALERTGHYRAAAMAYSGALAVDSTYTKAATNLDRVELLGPDSTSDTFDLRAEAAAFLASLHQEASAATMESPND